MTTLRFEHDRLSIKMTREEAAQVLATGHLIEKCHIPGGGRIAWSIRVDDSMSDIDVEGLAFVLPRQALLAELDRPSKDGLLRQFGATNLQIQVDLRRSKS